MAYFMSQMVVKTVNEDDYEIVKEWCEEFEENGDFEVYDPEYNDSGFEVTFDELDVDDADAEQLFKSFGREMREKDLSGEVEVYFNIVPDNCDEETQVLYKLNNGIATEQSSFVHISDMDEDELEDWRFNPDYSDPKIVNLDEEE